MPLKFDPEWQKEINTLRARAERGNRQVWWGHFLLVGAVLAGVISGLGNTGVSDGVLISITIATATLCLLGAFNSAIRTIHMSLTILVGAVEWVGRKQLGEYEPLGNSGVRDSK